MLKKFTQTSFKKVLLIGLYKQVVVIRAEPFPVHK